MGGVFDDRSAPRSLGDLLDRGHLPEQIDGDDRLGLVAHGRPNRVRGDIERARIDVDEHGAGPDVVDGACGREEREGRRDDLVARTDVERTQRQQEGIGTIGAADGVLDVRQSRHAALQLRHRIAEDERLLIHDVHDRGHDFVADRGVLRLEIEKRNGHDR